MEKNKIEPILLCKDGDWSQKEKVVVELLEAALEIMKRDGANFFYTIQNWEGKDIAPDNEDLGPVVIDCLTWFEQRRR